MCFFEDYKNFIYRMPQKLVFYKTTSSSSSHVLTHASKYTASINLKEIIWHIPQVKFNLLYDSKIKEEILRGVDYPLVYRHWRYNYKSEVTGKEYTWEYPVAYARTKYVLIGFQKDRKADVSKFDFCDLQMYRYN